MADYQPGDQHVWMGSLAGFEVGASMDGDLALVHRCGWSNEIAGADVFLGNLVEIALSHRNEGCRRG